MSARRFAVAALAICISAPAVGHEFDAAIVAPFSNEAEIGQGILRGLKFASAERDSHADMTSDGHLGGVDVHFKPVDSAKTLDTIKAALAELNAPIVFVAVPADLRVSLEDDLPGSVIFIPGLQPDQSNPALQDIARRFLAATGNEMNGFARIGYNAGRRIDLAVRPLDGVKPAEALDDAFEESAGGIDWGADF